MLNLKNFSKKSEKSTWQTFESVINYTSRRKTAAPWKLNKNQEKANVRASLLEAEAESKWAKQTKFWIK